MPDAPRPNPELMIIGDSLAQGCRSLTVNQVNCRQSWAARIAQEKGWDFVTPDFSRPILFDLEEEIRRLDTLTLSVENFEFKEVFDRLHENLSDWLQNRRESAHECFDNLGLSGALIHDLYTRSAATSAQELSTLIPSGDSSSLLLDEIGDLHLAINGRFTLNPSQDPRFNDFTPMEWVRHRCPRRLLVQIGHNHGLYQIGSGAEDVSFEQPGGDGSHGGYWDQWQTLANELASLPAEVGTLIVVLLPKVGAVANLQPREAIRENGYSETYGPVLGISTSVLPGARLAQIDAAILEANNRIRELIRDAVNRSGISRTIDFLDTFGLFDGHDYKNSLDNGKRITVGTDLFIDNRYISGRFHFLPINRAGWRLSAGGLQSADGMHPSGCGYAMLAEAAIELLGFAPPQGLFEKAFAEDTLLSNYPYELRAFTSLLQMTRDLGRTTGVIKSRETFLKRDLHAADILKAMQTLFFP